jgi:transposase-like protein
MKKQGKHYTPEEKAAILRRHLVERMPISDLCDELGRTDGGACGPKKRVGEL